ncbi:hypothetical protein SY26_12970 [Paracoccus sp. 228]|nr:hypothetical protein SY26_12970 [Paracoccus sp. 228]
MQKARQIGTELLLALTWACTLMLIILPAVLFLLKVLSLVTALPFASWPEALDLQNRFGWTGDLIFP